MIIRKVKKAISPIFRHWLIQLPLRGTIILFRAYIYPFIFHYKYKHLNKFKDCHKGQRCFIVASGPSLTIKDVDLLKNEYTFGMNSIYKLFDKTTWRPTYYAIVDNTVFKKIKTELLNQELNVAFYPDFYIDLNKDYANAIPVKGNLCSNARERALIPDKWRKQKFGMDMPRLFYNGTSVVHFIMQIAFYMGFKEIYLLGTDCNFKGDKKHCNHLQYKGSNDLGNTPEDIYSGLIKDYKKAKEVALLKNVKIYNATRGGALEVFERVKLEDVVL